MRILLDTQVLLWALTGHARLPSSVRGLLSSGEAESSFSLVSIWEIAIKRSLGKLGFDADLIAETAEADGYACLPIRLPHLRSVQALPWHHRDPFDRLLVAQSISEPMLLLTTDEALADYGPSVRLL